MEQDIESDSDDAPMCSCCPFQTSVDAKWTRRWFCEEAPHHGLQTLQNPRAHDRCSFAARSGNCSKKWRSLGNIRDCLTARHANTPEKVFGPPEYT